MYSSQNLFVIILSNTRKVDKFIRDEKEAMKDKSEQGKLARELTMVRGGQEFSDQFYSQHMRFYKGVSVYSFSERYFSVLGDNIP